MKLYCVFKEESHWYAGTLVSEWKLDNVYTTSTGAFNRSEKLLAKGIHSYTITKSLKGDILDLFVRFCRNKRNINIKRG